MNGHKETSPSAGEAIAVVGMAGRFPGAPDLERFWDNLVHGVESITRLGPEELAAAGVPAELAARPGYVPAAGLLDEPERFDADLFGVNPREAALLDPQQRLFLETAWATFEDAGLDPRRLPTGLRAGVFAGAGLNRYLIDHVYPTVDPADWPGAYQAALANDKDFLATRVSYKLGLEGPSLTVQTACSTSLVAVALACQNLATGDCDLALAGGVTLRLPSTAGYLFQEDGILSPDGHCRAFDAAARGTVPGSGVGAVLLERLEDAVAAGHPVRAVIRGWATNNDGADKAGYTAPRAEGQAQVVTEALALAGVRPETVSYVEAHGTGTRLGDPIEVAALTRAFGAGAGPGSVLLGSVKTNVGHLDAAAGIAGLIKAVLALEHGEVPPTLHFERPSPEIDWAGGPFRVAAERTPWPAGGPAPRRAGVSSFGIGGTNAHVVLEEAPPPPERPSPVAGPRLFVLSARSPEALDRTAERLAQHLRAHAGLDPAHVAHTLVAGRSPQPRRRAVVAGSLAEAADLVAGAEGVGRIEGTAAPGAAPVAFLLSGQGSQYRGMGGELYRRSPVFRRELDRCAEILEADPAGPAEPLAPLLAERRDADRTAEPLVDTALAQPLLFALEYALARLWASWGVEPEALLGHSVGEWTAACLAGVIDLDEALPLVAERGRLVAGLPPGAMVAVPLDESELAERIASLGAPGLAVAGINAPGLCAAAGPAAAVEALAAALEAEEIVVRRLHTSHAFHSPALDPAVAPFRERVARCRLRPPGIPFLSNVTGTWITDEEATDPGYWGRQLRAPVRFADAAAELLAEPRRVLLELGPGDALVRLLRRQPAARGRTVVASLPHATDRRSDVPTLLEAAGRLWVAGAEAGEGYADLEAPEAPRRRVRLPTYPFGGERHWIAATALTKAGRPGAVPDGIIAKEPDVADWFYAPLWRSVPPAPPAPPEGAEGTEEPSPGPWLLLVGQGEDGEAVAAELARRGEEAVVSPEGDDLDTRLADLTDAGQAPARVLYLRGVGALGAESAEVAPAVADLPSVVRALSYRLHGRRVDLAVVTDRLFDVAGEGTRAVERAALAGIAQVVPQEHPAIRCRLIDLAGAPGSAGAASGLLDEATTGGGASMVALRGRHRFERVHDRLPWGTVGASAPVAAGHYLVLGGLGRFALAVAERLAASSETDGLRLSLLDRRSPGDVEGAQERLDALRSRGARVDVAATELSDSVAFARAVSAAVERSGPLAGVVHAAGVPSSAFRTLADLREEDLREHLAPKVDGLRHLASALETLRAGGGEPLAPGAWVLAASSLAPVLGGVGLAPFAAADAALDALVESYDRELRAGARWRSVNWEGWEAPDVEGLGSAGALGRQQAALVMTAAEVGEAFERAVALPWRSGLPRLVAATGDLPARIARWGDVLRRREAPRDGAAGAGATGSGERPPGAAAYRPPSGPVETRVAEIWEELLGVERIGADDDFFLFGGDSLVGLQVLSKLRSELDVELPLRSFFEGRTVAGVAAVIEEERRRGADQERRMAEILAEVEALSEEEVASELSAEAEAEVPGPAPVTTVREPAPVPFVEPAAGRSAEAPAERAGRRGMTFSLFFFSADGSTGSRDKYRLLLEAARLADREGLAAVWTPERHFQDFGGLYPNPSVLGAALAEVTERLEIRAGSVVLPLHHPVRVAEEWAVVDNLSGGRAAISCASGWHPKDFSLRAGTWDERKDVMFRDLETIRRLWRGEEISVTGGDGRPYTVRSLPRPVRPELPVWVTSSGSVETWERAGAAGANLLSSLGTQGPEELADKVRRYRRSRADAGHDPGSGVVTLMLHTFLGDDLDEVKETVREPMTSYLRTHMAQRDDFVDVPGITHEDKESLLPMAFEHYVRSASLLGTPESCAPVVERLVAAGIDEIACLADFGLEAPAVLASLERVAELARRFTSEPALALAQGRTP